MDLLCFCKYLFMYKVQFIVIFKLKPSSIPKIPILMNILIHLKWFEAWSVPPNALEMLRNPCAIYIRI